MDQTKHVYETTFILNATLDDAQIDGVISRVTDLVQKHGGEIRELVKWGRKRFAYTIQKKNNGFYVVCEFAAPGDCIAKLERHYFLDENILRYLTILLTPKTLEVRVRPSELLGQPGSNAPPPQATAQVEKLAAVEPNQADDAGENAK